MAAAFVVSSHMTITLNRRIATPCCDDDGNTMLLQRPIFRLVMQGQAWVAVFFVMLGFVNSLKALKLSRSGDPSSAVTNLSQTAFRRICRLILPAWGATLVNWVLANLYLFEKARFGDGFWLAITAAPPSASWGSALDDLASALTGTWHMDFRNPYDQPQWAMIFLLQASIMVMAALMILVNFRPVPRMIALGLIMAWSTDWSWNNRDRTYLYLPKHSSLVLTILSLAMIGLTVFGGMAMCEISLSASVMRRLFRLSPILTPPFLFIGLYLMSFPTDFPDHAPWSLYLLELGQSLASNVNEWGRWWNSFGALSFLFAILISPLLRRALTHPLLQWLGNNSFSIYMIHGAVMRSVFTWILYLGQEPIYHEPTIEEYELDPFATGVWSYPLPSHGWTIVSIALFIPVLASCAHLWTRKVEPRLDRVAGWLESLVFMEGAKSRGGNAAGGNGNAGNRSPIPVTMEREKEKAKEKERPLSLGNVNSEKPAAFAAQMGAAVAGMKAEWKS